MVYSEGGGEKMQLDPSENAMQKNAKKCKKMQKSAKKCNFQRNSLINLSCCIKKASGAFGAGLKMSKKCNFPTFGLPFPSTKLHQDAKKCKKCNFWPKPKMQKKNAKKMQVAFFPSSGLLYLFYSYE